MKLSKSQTGFSPLHIVLLLVLLGIIGFTGWKVYDMNKSAKVADSSTTSVAKKQEPKPAVSTIPEGFVEYQNKELGFKFAYPMEWGETSFEQTAGEKGFRYKVHFSKRDHVLAGLLSADFENHKDFDCNNDIGVYPGNTIVSLSDYMKDGDENLDTLKATSHIIKKTDNAVIYERYAAGAPPMPDCLGLTITAYKLFSNNTKVAGIGFLWATTEVDNSTIPKENVATYKANPSKYISDTDRQNFIKVIESAKSL